MKNISYPLLLTLLLLTALHPSVNSQPPKQISLEDIYKKGRFTPDELEGLRSMNDGIHYTVQKNNRIEKYSYKTGDRVDVLFDADRHDEIGQYTAYHFNHTEDRILIETAKEQIYRHSYRAAYWVYDMKAGSLIPVSHKGKQQLGTFSPKGNQVAFVRDNNLYIRNLDEPEESQVTFDGIRNEVINGIPDWVYEEEFAFSTGFEWSSDGKRIAFYKFDEKRVKQFHMTLFGPLYPESYEFKYPKAGEDNSVVTIHVYDLQSGKTTSMDTGEQTDQYIPRIKWTTDPGILSMIRMNRHQNRFEILHADAASGKSEVVYQEENPRYISEANDHTVTYLDGGKQFILISEKSGYFHFYLVNYTNGEISPITSGPFDVHEFQGYDQKNQLLYYTSYEESSIERHLYSIGLDGSHKRRLSKRPGTSSAFFSSAFKYYILSHSSANSPTLTTLHSRNGKEIRVLVDNEELNGRISQHGFAKTEFMVVPTKSDQKLNAWMIKPTDFDRSRQYPLFVFVYGGPESQKVIDEWGDRTAWFQMLVQQGYIVACVDNRGTNGRGEDFRKATYLNLGYLETIDQLESAQWFGSLDYIDENRMGIFGWSYGGFMTSLCMTKGQGTFKMGIAVAPVTNWRYYDSVYTERFLRKPQENPEGYDNNSPIFFANGLEGKLLLIHGSGDDNVHYQNSMDFVEALVQADKQFEMQFYPNKSHGISGGNTSFHVYRRMTDFILENL